MPLSDNIEQFIKDLMSEQQSELEVKRNELASYFGCAPSQINYVLATRFSPAHGYIIESRRGGSGYVRIIRIYNSASDRSKFLGGLIEAVGTQLPSGKASAMTKALEERKIITAGEKQVLDAAVSDRAINLPVSAKDMLRAGIMRSVLTTLMIREREGYDV